MKQNHCALVQVEEPDAFMKIPLSPAMRQDLAGLTT